MNIQWGPIRDRIVEGRTDDVRSWLILNRELKVMGIYIKIKEVSKFLPNDEWEETLEGAKLRAEIEIERYFKAEEIAKLNKKGEYKI
jgi:hypothetical protein